LKSNTGMHCIKFNGSNSYVTPEEEDPAEKINRQGEVKVYRLNPDGSKGELIRIDPAWPEGHDMKAFKNFKVTERGNNDMAMPIPSKDELIRLLKEANGSINKASKLCEPKVTDVTFGLWLRQEGVIPQEGIKKSSPGKQAIEKALYDYSGNIQMAAARYGVSEVLFLCWMNNAGIKQAPTQEQVKPEPTAIETGVEPEPAEKIVPEDAKQMQTKDASDEYMRSAYPDVFGDPEEEIRAKEEGFTVQDDEPIPYVITAKYYLRGKEIGELVQRKNTEYGDSYNRSGEILAILYPEGIRPEEYKDVLGIIRVIDKLFRIAHGKQGNEDPWADIAGYGLLGMEESA